MAAQKKEINLLLTKELEKTRLGRLLRWALGFGRWIVIATELIVILCFLSRFKLDRDLVDLGETIKQQQAIINSLEGLENNFRNLQARLTTIDELEKKQIPIANLLNELTKITPLDVSFRSLNIDQKGIEISALALSELSLNQLIKGFNENPSFQAISLDKVSKRTTGEIEFSLKASYSQK